MARFILLAEVIIMVINGNNRYLIMTEAQKQRLLEMKLPVRCQIVSDSGTIRDYVVANEADCERLRQFVSFYNRERR